VSLLDLAQVASEQWGLVTTAQAVGAGASPQMMARWANEGALVRLTHGVYKVAGSSYHPLDDLRAAWLALSPTQTATERIASKPIDAVVSHQSAARVHNLGDLSSDTHQFTAQNRKQSRRPDVMIRRRSGGIDQDSWRLVDGLPTTTVLTTIVDLAASFIDGGHLAGVVRDAIATATVDIRMLSEDLGPYAHRYGAPVGDGDGLIERFLAEAGVPQATVEAADFIASLSRRTRSDAALRAIAEKLNRPEVRQALEALTDPGKQRNLAQLNENLETLRRIAG
jgi:predicted transcriptional regulator of viral defense system